MTSRVRVFPPLVHSACGTLGDGAQSDTPHAVNVRRIWVPLTSKSLDSGQRMISDNDHGNA